MAGSWTNEDKIIPGAYINFRTNQALSITPGERGCVCILQEMSCGTAGDVYTITPKDESEWPLNAKKEDKILAALALRGASKVKVYNLGVNRDADMIISALKDLKVMEFETLVYPYDDEPDTQMKTAIVNWIGDMRETEGKKVVGILANVIANAEYILNVVQGVKTSDTTYTAGQVTAWVGGVTAGATVYSSNTGKKFEGAVDVIPRYTKTEMEAAITAGKYIFKVDEAQNVTVVYDINTLTTFTEEKSKIYSKNRIIRCMDGMNKDITEIYESNFVGKINNNEDGRALLKGKLVEYMKELEKLNAIQNFDPSDITVSAGADSDAVVINIAVQTVDSIEKIYITVNLA